LGNIESRANYARLSLSLSYCPHSNHALPLVQREFIARL
jgi:hypothetical protein